MNLEKYYRKNQSQAFTKWGILQEKSPNSQIGRSLRGLMSDNLKIESIGDEDRSGIFTNRGTQKRPESESSEAWEVSKSNWNFGKHSCG